MTHADLYRYAYTPTETQGRFVVGDLEIWTIEKPWVAGNGMGGKPFESCVPDGVYNLVPYERASGVTVPALLNPSLGVNLFKEDGHGRYGVLIHSGNWVTDVVGCIAPGLSRGIGQDPDTKTQEVMVNSSKAAMKKLAELMPFDEQHTLTIHNSTGTL